MTPDEETLARQLMAAGRLNPEQLAHCQALAAERGVGLGQVFAAYGLVPPSRLTRSLVSDSQGPSVDAPPLDADLPRQVGRYAIVRELGRGGMGVVLEARDPQLGRSVAIKMILSQGEIPARRLQRFQQESQAVAKLRHPGVVPVHEIGEHEGRPYLVMEYVDGTTLHTLRKAEDVTPRRAAELTRELADVLHAAHQQGIVHRDVKPENAMLDSSGRVRLMDFGLARDLAREGELTKTGAMLGTPFYMAPEQARGDRLAATPSADVYSLGAVLYFLIAGRPPYLAEGVLELMAQLHERDPDPLSSVARVHGDLEAIAHRALERDPAYRYRSAEEVRDELDRFLAGEPILARSPGRVERWKRWARRHRLQAMLALIALLVLASLLALGVSAGVYAVQRIRRERDRAGQAQRAAEASAREAKASATQARAAEREASAAEQEARAAAAREAQAAAKLERELASGRALLRRARIERAQRLASEGLPAEACALALDLLEGEDDPALRVLLGQNWFAATRLRWSRPPRLGERVSGALNSEANRVALGIPQGRVYVVAVGDQARSEINVAKTQAREQVLHTLVAHEGWVLDLDFAEDGRLLSAGADGWLKVWGTDGQQVAALLASEGAISAARFLGADAIVFADSHGVVKRWDVGGESARELWTSAGGAPVLALEVTGEEGLLCGDATGSVTRLDPDGVRWERSVHEGAVLDLDVWEGNVLSAGFDGGLSLRSLAGDPLWEGTHRGATAVGFVSSAAWTSVDAGGEVRDWVRAANGAVTHEVRKHTAREYWTGVHELRRVGGVQLSVGPLVGMTPLGGPKTKSLEEQVQEAIGDRRKIEELARNMSRGLGKKTTRVLHLPSEFNRRAVAASPRDDLAALAYSNGYVDLLRASTGSRIARLRGERATEAMAFSADGRRLATVERKGRMAVWDLSTREARELFQCPGEQVGVAVAFDPTGRYVAGAFKRSVLCVADLETGETLEIPFAGQGAKLLDSVAFDGGGEQVFLSFQGRVQAFTVTGTPTWSWSPPDAPGSRRLGGGTYVVRAGEELIVAHGPNLHRLGFDGSLRGTLSPLPENVAALASAGRTLAATAGDGSLLLWGDVDSPPFALRLPDARLLTVGRHALVVSGHRSGVRAFAPPPAPTSRVVAQRGRAPGANQPSSLEGGLELTSEVREREIVWRVTGADGTLLWEHAGLPLLSYSVWDARTLLRRDPQTLAVVDAPTGEVLVEVATPWHPTATLLRASLDGRYVLLQLLTSGELVVLDRTRRGLAWRSKTGRLGSWILDGSRLLVCDVDCARVLALADGAELARGAIAPGLDLGPPTWNGVELIAHSRTDGQAWRWDLSTPPRREPFAIPRDSELTADAGGRLLRWISTGPALRVLGSRGEDLGTLHLGSRVRDEQLRLVAPGVLQVRRPNRTTYVDAFPVGRDPRELSAALYAQSGVLAHGFDLYFAPGWPAWLWRTGGRGLPLAPAQRE